MNLRAIVTIFAASMAVAGCVAEVKEIFGFKDSGTIADELKNSGQSNLMINFETNSSKLTPDAQNQVAEVSKALKAIDLNRKTVLIVGHTDSRGSADHNQTLSLERAFAVVEVLTKKYGFAANTIRWDGKGKSAPLISPEVTDEDRARNRRVEVRLVDKK